MERQIALQPFLGVVTSVDGTLVPQTNASDCLNVRLEDGRIKPRYGWQQLDGAPSNFDTNVGLCFIRGFNSSGTEKAEYMSFESRLGQIQPYAVNIMTGARTVITENGGVYSLTSGEYNATGYDSYAYWHQVGGTVQRYTIGSPSTSQAVDASQPAVATDAPTVTFVKTEKESNTAAKFNWDGITGAGLTQGGTGSQNVAFVSVTSHQLNLDFPTIVADITSYDYILDMSATTLGIQDYSGVSFVEFDLEQSTTGNNGRWIMQYPLDSAVTVKFINSAGTTITMTVQVTRTYDDDDDKYVHKIRATFPKTKVASDWITTKKIRVTVQEFYPNHLAQNVRLVMTELRPNTTDKTPPTDPGTSKKVKFGYAFYDSLRDIESGTVKDGRWYRMQTDVPQRYFDADGDKKFIGNKPTVTVSTIAQDNVDKYRIYVWWDDLRVWQLVGTYGLGDLTQEVDLSFTNLRALPSRRYRAYTPIGSGTLWIGTYGGSLVYLKQATKNNIKISAVGNPFRLADSNYDLDTDFTRGRTMSMSPSFDDKPVCSFEADRSLIVLGARGAYASVGDGTPASLTPPRRLPNSKGVLAMRSACRWRNDEGVSGVAYLGTDNELYFVAVFSQFDGEQGFRLEELTRDVRGLISSFLFATPTPNTLRLQVGVDERSDSLWIIYNYRAMVLRRASVIDGRRHWECYSYDNTVGWLRMSIDSYYGIRAIDLNGAIGEFEYDSSNSWQPIVGATRDNGSAINNGIYWTSKTWNDINRRLYTVQVERATISDTVSVTIVSDRATTTKTVASNKHIVKFPAEQQGWNHKVKLSLTTNSSAINKVILTERYPSGRRLKA